VTEKTIAEQYRDLKHLPTEEALTFLAPREYLIAMPMSRLLR